MYQIKCATLQFDRINITDDFIKTNNLQLKRSQSEILDFLKDSRDICGFRTEVLCEFLGFEESKHLYNSQYIEKIIKGEKQHIVITDINEAVQDFLDYMVFAWGKALDERGISASRSIAKLGAYLWLFGRDDLYRIISYDHLYNPYGMPALLKICDKLGIKYPNECTDFIENYGN